MHKYMIFATDDQSPEGRATFQAWFRGMKHEGLVEGELIPAIGCYEGDMEYCYLSRTSNLSEIKMGGFVDLQNSILLVSECNKAYSVLFYRDGTMVGVGCMKAVTQEEAHEKDNWTYRPDIDMWFTTVQENPNTVPECTYQVKETTLLEMQSMLDLLLTHDVQDRALSELLLKEVTEILEK